MLLNRTVVSVLAQAGCLTVIIALGSLLIGILLDNIFDTKPRLTALFFAGSLPLAMAAIYWRVKAATAHLSQTTGQKAAGSQETGNTQEETTSDRKGS